MKVLFADVGQGTCQVILLGQQKAIVIDAGSSPELPLRLLQLFKIRCIELLVVSHSHIDHSGGVVSRRKHRLRDDSITGLLVNYQSAINRIAYVYDSEFRKRPVGKYLYRLVKDGVLRPEQLEAFVANAKPYLLWDSEDGKTTLAAISPLGGDQLVAFEEGRPNASSAVLELRHAGQKIVFAADSEFQQWREIHRLRSGKTLGCKVLTMPHHGGQMKGAAEDLRWFCNAATKSEVVVVSVATVNPHGHPKREVIQAFAASGSHVMCTQITEQCCSDLESLRPGLIGPPSYPGRSSVRADLTSGKKRSRNVACAGTVAANLVESGIEIERAGVHSDAIARRLPSGSTPICRLR